MGSEILRGEIRLLKSEDIDQAFNIESEGYPSDEGASHDALVFRQSEAPELFLGYFEGYQLKGFICGTRYPGPHLQEESMSNHCRHADCVCIHSVCVEKRSQSKGIAKRLLNAYIERAKSLEPHVSKILLICKAQLIPLYTRVGFEFVKKSSIIHGHDCWYDMELRLSR
ncbi:hypothetical protein CAPTEDRAFT_185754 [Capitella teleta]|uniref:Serotonin N-acetyltransferase n=1 Tax=Capitella teleta TaxID=283909 RepID=R7VI42_CAPTE|nr:hypothetical protein CAPTEDRAFT_185754 [Capitella teleta]|eukprot:ELU18274.1 hypothetical protein CAPTEDRAFT_185754 [Capitella teleta]